MKKNTALVLLVCVLMAILTACNSADNGYINDTEYYLYFGLNDKETGEQIYTKEQATEKLQQICMEEGIGFTAYEAFGAYLENDKPITNETLAFMLLMTNESQAANVAETAKTELNLASVLIVKKPVSYKFV